MGVLGKILAVLNLLAGAGFLYLASMDMTQRQHWAYAVFRTRLSVNGLPLDAEDRDPVENVRVVDRLNPATLSQIFQGLGDPVETQRKEVEAVHQKLQTAVNSQAEEAGKRRLLESILLPLATSGPVRDALAARLRDPKAPTALLTGENGPLERVFKAVLSQKQLVVDVQGESQAVDPFEWAFGSADFKESNNARGPQESRRVIAHLLVNLAPENEPAQRALVVLGLREFTDEANREAATLQDMADRIKLGMMSDRYAFISRYRAVLNDLQVLAEQLKDRDSYLGQQKQVQEEDRLLVVARQEDVKALQADLEKARDTTRAALQSLLAEQEALFQAQEVVGRTQRQNEALLGEIQRRENVKP